MARNYKPKRFAKIGILKKIDFPLLLRLLEPYRLYFEGHSDFAWSTEPDQFAVMPGHPGDSAGFASGASL